MEFYWGCSAGAAAFCRGQESSCCVPGLPGDARHLEQPAVLLQWHWASSFPFQRGRAQCSELLAAPPHCPSAAGLSAQVSRNTATYFELCLLTACPSVGPGQKELTQQNRKDHMFSQHGISKRQWPELAKGLIGLILAHHAT